MPSHQPAAGYLAKDPQYLSPEKTTGKMAKPSEPNRNKAYDPKKSHITDQPMTKKNWYKYVNWLNVTLIVGIPLMGCIAAFWTPVYLKTALFTVVYYFATGLGITAGKSYRSLFHTMNTYCCQVITASGHTHLTLPPSPSASSSPLLVAVRSKAPSAGGPVTTVPITVTPIQTRTPTPSAKASFTAISAGWLWCRIHDA